MKINCANKHEQTSADIFIRYIRFWKQLWSFGIFMGRHEPAHYMKYEFEKSMRFCGMNVYFDTRQASADSSLCQGLPSDILSIYIIIYFNG